MISSLALTYADFASMLASFHRLFYAAGALARRLASVRCNPSRMTDRDSGPGRSNARKFCKIFRCALAQVTHSQDLRERSGST